MKDSVFTKIRKKQIPANIVYSDGVCFVILSIEPHNPGHLLLIPNVQVADWQDVDSKDWLHMMQLAQKLGKTIQKLYKAPKIALCTVGFEVPHVHIHIFSLFEISDINHDKAKPMDPQKLAQHAQKIKTALESS